MENKGRLTTALDSEVSQCIFQETPRENIQENLPFCIQVDKAHTIMLAIQGHVSHTQCRDLLRAFLAIESNKTAKVYESPRPRGWYLAYEKFLRETVGELADHIHTARSRNDLEATIFKLKIRDLILEFSKTLISLASMSLEQALKFKDSVYVLQTQLQPAFPMSFGHYLQGLCLALIEQADQSIAILELNDQYSPLGACAGAGTGIPIDTQFTAKVLGFKQGPKNAIHSVASFTSATRIQSLISETASLLSRFLTDFHLGLTQEYGFFSLPDHLLGTSSIMPQKANTFVLEDAKARFHHCLGGSHQIISGLARTPYTNMRECKLLSHLVFENYQYFDKGSFLFGKVLASIQVKKDNFRKNESYIYCLSLSLAEFLVRKERIPFRQAHHKVGSLVRDCIENQKNFRHEVEITFPDFDGFNDALNAYPYGGGFNHDDFSKSYQQNLSKIRDLDQSLKSKIKCHNDAQLKLEAEVNRFL